MGASTAKRRTNNSSSSSSCCSTKESSSSNSSNGADDVGRRLSIVLNKTTKCRATVVAFFPKTRKHRIRLDADQHEKNVLLQDLHFHWLHDDNDHDENDHHTNSNVHSNLSSYERAVQRDAVGRRLQVFHHVRQKWYQATVTKYVERCQQHIVVLEPQGKVHLVDLKHCPWRYTDLIAASNDNDTDSSRNPQDLATSKYLGVVRHTETTWKAYYRNNNDECKYLGCFASDKDAALAHDVYARKRQTPVNFADRRICRAEMKRLRVPEPPQVVAKVPSTTPVVEVPSSSSAAVVVESAPSKEHDSDATPSLEEEEGSESTLNGDHIPQSTEHHHHDHADKQHTGRVTPTSVTEVTSHEREHEVVDHHSAADKWAQLKKDPTEDVGKRRISVGDDEEEEEDDGTKSRRNTVRSDAFEVIRANIFVDSEDEAVNDAAEDDDDDDDDEEYEFHDDDEEEEDHSDDEEKQHNIDNDMDNVFSDEESVEVLPKRKSRKAPKSAAKARRGRGRLVAEETLSFDDEADDLDLDLDESEYVPPAKPQKSTKKKKKSKKRKRGTAQTPKYAVGTRFIKEFPDYGTFEGEITHYDGSHYHVYYPADEDEEELSEYEFEDYEILPANRRGNHHEKLRTTTTKSSPSCVKARKKDCHKRRKKKRANRVID